MLRRQRSILQPSTLYCVHIFSPSKAVIIFSIVSCSLKSYLLSWIFIPNALASILKLYLDFLLLRITYWTPFFWQQFICPVLLVLGPGQTPAPIGGCLYVMSCGHFTLIQALHWRINVFEAQEFPHMSPFEPRVAIDINNRFNFTWKITDRLQRHLYLYFFEGQNIFVSRHQTQKGLSLCP